MPQSYPKPGNNPLSDNYNQGWRNHPNLSWSQQATENAFKLSTSFPQTQNFPNTSRPPPYSQTVNNTTFENKVFCSLEENT